MAMLIKRLESIVGSNFQDSNKIDLPRTDEAMRDLGEIDGPPNLEEGARCHFTDTS